jgi:hypothetical protein
MRKTRRGISKVAVGDQHGIFQHFQSNTTDYATRERYLSQRGGETPIGRDTESLYNISPEGDDSRVPTEYVAPHLSTRYSPDRVGVQAKRVSDGVYQDPYTNKVYDYNEGFKTEDGRSFPGGSASLQSSLVHAANVLDKKGLTKEASRLDEVLGRLSGNKEFIKLADDHPVWDVSDTLSEEEADELGLVGEGLKVDTPPEGITKEELVQGCVEMSLVDIIKALFSAHEDVASPYKLSPARLNDLDPCNLTEDEKGIVGDEKTALAHTVRTLIFASNALDKLGLKRESDTLDLSIKELAKHAKAQYGLNPIINVASSLDERGLYDISDLLDTWMSKSAAPVSTEKFNELSKKLQALQGSAGGPPSPEKVELDKLRKELAAFRHGTPDSSMEQKFKALEQRLEALQGSAGR